jgi:hypothetical protein
MPDIDLSGLSVALMMSHRDARDITVPTMNSVVSTITALRNYDIKCEFFSRTGGDILLARNAMAEKFLGSEHNRSFLFDSDLSWTPESVLRILFHSLRYEVVGAGYRAKSERPFWLVQPPATFTPDKFGCIPIVGMGLGFTCVHRAVFEQLSAKAPKYRHVQHNEPFPKIFRFEKVYSDYKGEHVHEPQGEDFSFFKDVAALGYTPMMDPSIELGHHGMAEFKGSFSEVIARFEPAAA